MDLKAVEFYAFLRWHGIRYAGHDYLDKLNARCAQMDMLKISYRILSGSSVLTHAGEKTPLKGVDYVIYQPAEVEPYYIFDRAEFIEILQGLNLIRKKRTTDGKQAQVIQTIWNNKQHKPHSIKKYCQLIDKLEAKAFEIYER